MTWIPAVADRTLVDVQTRTAKAYMNIADFVRIYGNTAEVMAMVNSMLNTSGGITSLVIPTITQFPTVEDINTLIANIEIVRQAACLPDGAGVNPLVGNYQAGSGGDAPDYLAVNAWENNLDMIHNLLPAAAGIFIYCGVGKTGQPHLWQNQFRPYSAYIPPAGSWNVRPLCGVTTSGTGMVRQNKFRRYV